MPTQQDVQRLIALREARKRGMMGPTQTAALQEIERRMSMGDQVAKVAEPAMTIASSMVAEPLSGLAGIAGTILPGPQGQGADWVNRTQDALTYMPRTEGGMQSLQGLASLMQPVSDVMQGAEQSMGDFGYENFGPGVGAMMAAIPAAASEVAGVGRPARAARRADDVVDAARTADRMGDVSRRSAPKILKDEGDVSGVVTGQPVEFNFVRNTQSASKSFGKPEPGDRFGRDIEPAGRYMNPAGQTAVRAASERPEMETGRIKFDNPIVIDNDQLQWKKVLSERYGGKTGKDLSKALKQDGYDGIITLEDTRRGQYISEVIDLSVIQ